MTPDSLKLIHSAKEAALGILLHNARGPFEDLPRTAGWGYPEPYTRDLLFSILGIVVSDNAVLLASVRTVLETLAINQSEKGHIPSLVHDSEDRGASDTTPLFLLTIEIYRQAVKEPDFLQIAVDKALLWMEYQSPTDRYLVAQQPTSDWRDEQWVLGYGLYVNSLVYSYLRLMGYHERAKHMIEEMGKFFINQNMNVTQLGKGTIDSNKPYLALWTYKVFKSERFDLLGNSLAILSGIVSSESAILIIDWVESECIKMKACGELNVDLPPNFFPFIHPEDTDWHTRYAKFNLPGNYHNGGIWPFICGLYIAAIVATENKKLAEIKLIQLTELIQGAGNGDLEFGFNEWYKAQNGKAMGQDWQTWSAALYLYAVKCVESNNTPFFDIIRKNSFEDIN